VRVQLTSDRGTQFTSAIWDVLCQQLGIQYQPTTAFHPQANGMVERCQCRLKDAFRSRLAGPDWHLHLPWVLMGLRAAPTEDTGVSATEIVFGAPLVLPGQILLTRKSRHRLTSSPNCGNSVRCRLHVPSPSADGGQAHGGVVISGIRVRSQGRRSSPLVAGGKRSSPWARRFAGCRWASGRSRSPLTALSRTGGRSCPASTAVSKGPAASWLIFFSSSTPESRLGLGSCSRADRRDY
jgi:hypothetical protein